MPSITGPITGLINDIRDSVTNLVDDITGAEVDSAIPAYPQTKDIQAVLSTVNSGNWLKLSFPYTFSVVDVTGQSANPFTDFSLPLAPSAIQQSEEFAIAVRSTQGGTTVTHSGNKYKTLNIEGTTGIAPFRGTGGVSKRDGEAIFQPNELKYRSGYEVFLDTSNDPNTSVGTTTTETTLSDVPVTSGQVYSWKVVTTDSAGNTSTSEIFEFRVEQTSEYAIHSLQNIKLRWHFYCGSIIFCQTTNHLQVV